jgi:hypothetical protein
MLPGTAAYVYLGYVGKTAVDASSAAQGGGGLDAIKLALYGALAGSLRMAPTWCWAMCRGGASGLARCVRGMRVLRGGPMAWEGVGSKGARGAEPTPPLPPPPSPLHAQKRQQHRGYCVPVSGAIHAHAWVQGWPWG